MIQLEVTTLFSRCSPFNWNDLGIVLFYQNKLCASFKEVIKVFCYSFAVSFHVHRFISQPVSVKLKEIGGEFRRIFVSTELVPFDSLSLQQNVKEPQSSV